MDKNITVLDIADYSGRRVVLDEGRWNHHIKREHPETIGCLRGAEDTLRDPSFVHEAKDCEATHLYYRLGATERFRYLYLVVVVRCDLQLT